MLNIVICVGSSCHVRGADDLAGAIEELIERHGLRDMVELTGSFCMEHCSMGVSIRVGDEVFSGVRPEDAETFFAANVLARLPSA